MAPVVLFYVTTQGPTPSPRTVLQTRTTHCLSSPSLVFALPFSHDRGEGQSSQHPHNPNAGSFLRLSDAYRILCGAGCGDTFRRQLRHGGKPYEGTRVGTLGFRKPRTGTRVGTLGFRKLRTGTRVGTLGFRKLPNGHSSGYVGVSETAERALEWVRWGFENRIRALEWVRWGFENRIRALEWVRWGFGNCRTGTRVGRVRNIASFERPARGLRLAATLREANGVPHRFRRWSKNGCDDDCALATTSLTSLIKAKHGSSFPRAAPRRVPD
jgi:hypothetical protein